MTINIFGCFDAKDIERSFNADTAKIGDFITACQRQYCMMSGHVADTMTFNPDITAEFRKKVKKLTPDRSRLIDKYSVAEMAGVWDEVMTKFTSPREETAIEMIDSMRKGK